MILDIHREKNDIDLVLFGDLHFGDLSCNVHKVKKMIDWIDKNPKARVILMGDILNCATKTSVGAAVYDESSHGQTQYDIAIDMLLPIKNKIWGVLIGNHEQRILNSTGYNVSKLMSKDLDCKYYGYGQFIKIIVGKQTYNLFCTHGSSNATLPYTKIKGCLNLALHKKADIYCMGHVHDLQVHTQEVERIEYSQVVTDKVYFILTGHYLNYHDSYAEMKNMIPSKQGSPVLRLHSKEKLVRVSL